MGLRPLSLVALLAALSTMGVACGRMPRMPAPLGGPADACQACLVTVRILEDFLCDPAATDFLVDFVDKQICPAMGDTDQCHNLAEGLLPTLIQWFRVSATPASVCSSAGVCGDALVSVPELNQPALRVKDSAQCALCEFVIDKVKTAVNDSAVLEKIKEAALQACSQLPSQLSASCTDFVNTYEPMIAMLIEDMDDETVCALMGVCAGAAAAHPPPPLPASLVTALMPLLRVPPPPPHAVTMMRAMKALGAARGEGPRGPGPMGHGPMMGMMGGFGMPGPHAPFGGPLGDACDYCKMAVIEAHSLVSNPTVQAEVLNYTKAVCEQFPTFVDTCKSYADLYAPLVFTLLEQYLVPDTLCAQTGMCPPPPQGAMQHLLPGGKGSAPGAALLDWVSGVARSIGSGAEALKRGVEDVLGVHTEPQQRERQ